MTASDGSTAILSTRLAPDAALAIMGANPLLVSASLVLDFDVPRPKALLGDQHFRRLVSGVMQVKAGGSFRGLRLGAAGADSSVFQRLGSELERATRLERDDDEGELFLRFIRAGRQWRVLVRLTPRPFSARQWRVCNMEGGLNATLAAFMVRGLLHGVQGGTDAFLNAMCGSGTLLVEWLLRDPRATGTAIDLEASAIECAGRNLRAAGVADRATLLQADATATGLPAGSVDLIAADPPWGDDVGSSDSNRALYPAFLAESARLLRPGGRLALLSHEVRLTESMLRSDPNFSVISETRVRHGGHHPRAWLLQRG